MTFHAMERCRLECCFARAAIVRDLALAIRSKATPILTGSGAPPSSGDTRE
jgi:hypothetical protein